MRGLMILAMCCLSGCALFRLPAQGVVTKVDTVRIRIPIPEISDVHDVIIRDSLVIDTPDLRIEFDRVPSDTAQRYIVRTLIKRDTVTVSVPQTTITRTVHVRPTMKHNATWASYGAGAVLLILAVVALIAFVRR